MKHSYSPVTYYACTVDFTAPVNRRVVRYFLTDSQVKNHYAGKPVAQIYDRFVCLFRRYADHKSFVKNIQIKQTLMQNKPNISMTFICLTEELLEDLIVNTLKLQ